MILALPAVPTSKVPRLRAACVCGLVAWLAVATPALADHREENEKPDLVEVDDVPAVTVVRNPVFLISGLEPDGDIGDPWWDDVGSGRVANEPDRNEGRDASPADGDTRRPNEPMRARAARQRGQAAMHALRGDLSLVRQTSPALDAAARAEILAAGRRAVDENSAAPSTTPRTHVRAALSAALEAYAGAGAVVAWQREIDQRSERRRRAALAVIVEAVDQSHGLDDGRRAAVAEGLVQGWQNSWEMVLGHAQRPGRSLPSGVAECVTQALGAAASSQQSGDGTP
jgi:hypothetical protein